MVLWLITPIYIFLEEIKDRRAIKAEKENIE
jgi:hypothetical protein